MMRKSTLILILAALTFSFATVWATHSQKQDPKANARNDATPVKEGVLTARQIEHSRLYMQSGRQKKITTAPDGTTLIIGLPWEDESRKNNLNFSDFLRGMTCNSDAVVLGTVKSKTSQLTPDSTFIFTDYELTVDEALRNNQSAYIQPKYEITVTRPGG